VVDLECKVVALEGSERRLLSELETARKRIADAEALVCTSPAVYHVRLITPNLFLQARSFEAQLTAAAENETQLQRRETQLKKDLDDSHRRIVRLVSPAVILCYFATVS
jgi:predicted  nucleic acid-binding Zn-ribbon protein